MNYHIITQEKFFDEYIEDIYAIHQEESNVIWVRGNKKENCWLKTSRPVEYLGNDPKTYREKLRKLRPEDKLFVSWYDVFIGEIILSLNLKNKLYVYLMGAEFYSQPEWWHEGWLLDPKTKKRVYKQYLLPRFFPPKKPWRWYRCLNYFKFKKTIKNEYQRKLETIKRIDYIVITEHSGPEVELVKKLYPGCHARHAIGSFGQNFELARMRELIPIPKKGQSVRILFGNSSDPNGNHLDAMHFLSKNIVSHFELYSFLSYGDKKCQQWTMERGKKLFGDCFHPITEYMNRQDFVDFVRKMDVVMMFHNRQQAEGNIMTALVLGKPVFMKTMNPQYDMLKRMGVKSVYDVMEMPNIDFVEAITLAQKQREDTIRIIEKEYSRESRLTYLKDLLC